MILILLNLILWNSDIHANVVSMIDLAVGDYHGLSIDSQGFVYGWGTNSSGQLGLGDTSPRSLPVKIKFLQNVRQIAARGTHSCILSNDARVKCWGNNKFGQTGLGTNASSLGALPSETAEKIPFIDFGGGIPSRLVLGKNHTCILFDDGLMKCFGSNRRGELGIESSVPSIGLDKADMGVHLKSVPLGSERISQACAGDAFTCALTMKGEVKCWGCFDAIGSGGKSDLGVASHQMGAALKSVSLGSGQAAQQINCGARHACAILTDGSVKCWGFSQSGNLGIGFNDEVVLGDEPNELGDALPRVPIEPGLRTKKLACGGFHCCVVLQNSAVKCWGRNQVGALGLGDSKNRGQSLADMGAALPYVDLGEDFEVASFKIGLVSSFALFKNGSVKSWGGNHLWELGKNSNLNAVGILPEQMGGALAAIPFPD